MKIGPAIIGVEKSVGRQVQKGIEKASTGLKSIEMPTVPAPVKQAGNVTLGAAKFVTGNIMGAWSAVIFECVGRPVIKAAEHVSRALGCENLAFELKEAQKNVTPLIKESYEMFGAPKSGAFMTQDVGDLAEKAGNAVKSLFKK